MNLFQQIYNATDKAVQKGKAKFAESKARHVATAFVDSAKERVFDADERYDRAVSQFVKNPSSESFENLVACRKERVRANNEKLRAIDAKKEIFDVEGDEKSEDEAIDSPSEAGTPYLDESIAAEKAEQETPSKAVPKGKKA